MQHLPISLKGTHHFKDDGIIEFCPGFLPKELADQLFELCKHIEGEKRAIPWSQGNVKVGNKWFVEPRLTAFLGKVDGLQYTYNEKLNVSVKWPDLVGQVKQKIEEVAGHEFNVVLMNWYPGKNHHVGWHSDSEDDLVDGAAIASLSLGATRPFQLRHKSDSSIGRKQQELSNARKDGIILTEEQKKTATV